MLSQEQELKINFIVKTICFSVIVLFSFLSLSHLVLAAERDLEINYPTIPGEPAPEFVSIGLPKYVEYIFRLSIIIIGFVVFGALIYNGVRFLLSSGDPAKLSDAREGIFIAFLGAVILLSAYLIFNTINPQLTIFKLPDVTSLEAQVKPGVHICTYNVYDETKESLPGIISDFILQTGDRQIEAARKLRKIIVWDLKEKKYCYKVGRRGNLPLPLEPNDTIFIIPRVQSVYENVVFKKLMRVAIFEYGIVLHEEDNGRGFCGYYPKPDSNNLIFTHEVEYSPIIPIEMTVPTRHEDFDVESVTLFQKPFEEPPGNSGVILYTCLDHNRQGEAGCPEDVTPRSNTFTTHGGDVGLYPTQALLLGNKDKNGFAENTRSVEINPAGSYLALMFSGENFTGDVCQTVVHDYNMLIGPNVPIGSGCSWTMALRADTKENILKYCDSLLNSMIVIKAQALY